MKYFKPRSVSWWSGLVLALSPAFKFLGIEVPEGVAEFLLGSGLIGLRAAAGK